MSRSNFKDSKILFADGNFDSLLDFLKINHKSSNIFVLTDDNTSKYCLPVISNIFQKQFEFTNINFVGGEKNKTIEFCINIWNQLSSAGADKNSLLINLGGGVITDLGGFVASTYLRGINFINIPTSLMGMVDAAIGGKNGVDLNNIKNQIGSINFPELVFINPLFLKTLDDRNFKNGLAEVFKHGLIADKSLWQLLSNMEITRESIGTILAKTIAVKDNIVAEDPYENGKRKILNFGHTIGHALESCILDNDDKIILHGEAIVAGMIMETWLSEMHNGLSYEDSKEITRKLISVFRIHDFSKIKFDKFLNFISHDKKNFDHQIIFSLLSSIGNCNWDLPVSLADIKLVFERYKSSSLL